MINRIGKKKRNNISVLTNEITNLLIYCDRVSSRVNLSVV